MIHTIVTPIKDAIATMPLFTTGTDTRIAGIVRPSTRYKDGRSFVLPAAFDVEGRACWEQGRYFELLPNDLYRAVVYFEQLSDVRFEGYKDSKDRIMIYQVNLRLVCWVNFKKMGTTDLTITDRLSLGVIKALTATKGEISRTSGKLTVTDGNFTNSTVEVEPVSQVRQDRSIFSRYTIKEDNLLYPWDYFAINLACTLYVGRECFTEVVAGEEIEC